MESISVTIPNKYNTLIAAAKMFNELAEGLNLTPISVATESEALSQLGSDKVITPAALHKVDNPDINITNNETNWPKLNPAGIQVDKANRPWDARIHSSGKKLKQKDDEWKLAKNKDPELVKKVLAEIDAAMAALPISTNADGAAPPPPADTTAPPPPADNAAEIEIIYQVGSDTFTAQELRDSGWSDEQIAKCDIVANKTTIEDITAVVEKIMTFPEFAGALTKAGIRHDDPKVTAAVAAVGLPSFQILAARPDLVPAVYQAIFG